MRYFKEEKMSSKAMVFNDFKIKNLEVTQYFLSRELNSFLVLMLYLTKYLR